jgi:hypothetical protein
MMLRGRNELARPPEEHAAIHDQQLAQAKPHVVHVRIVRRGLERRHNYMRRWRYRGVDELRRQQTGQPADTDSTELDAAC